MQILQAAGVALGLGWTTTMRELALQEAREVVLAFLEESEEDDERAFSILAALTGQEEVRLRRQELSGVRSAILAAVEV